MSTSTPLSILVLADPGLCSRRAARGQENIEKALSEQIGPVRVEVRTQLLGISEDNTVDLGVVAEASLSAPSRPTETDEYVDADEDDPSPSDAAQSAPRRGEGEEHLPEGSQPAAPDILLLLTEMPLLMGRRPMVAELVPQHDSAVVSLPAAGVATPLRRLTDVLTDCALQLHRLRTGAAETGGVEHLDGTPGPRRWLRWRAGPQGEQGRRTLRLMPGAPMGAARTVMGMVVTNAPWATARKLSAALAAAAATGMFGIFYGSIWEMAHALSTERLLSIALLAVVAMTAWLMWSNGLWDRARSADRAKVLLYYNLSTVTTLLIVVAALWVLLMVLILAAGLVVIDPGYLGETLGESPRLQHYLDIAWISASMGVVAGSLGSSFDAETDRRELTHGQREGRRREAVLEAQEDGSQHPRR